MHVGMPVVSLRHHPKFENCNVDKKKSRIFPVKELSNVVGCHAEGKKIYCVQKKVWRYQRGNRKPQMAKKKKNTKTNNHLQRAKRKTEDWAIGSPQKTRMDSGASERFVGLWQNSIVCITRRKSIISF